MRKLRNILIIFVTIGLLISGFQLLLRFMAERRNTLVEIVADYEDFSDIALETGIGLDEMMNNLIGAGVTSIAISEENLEDMKTAGKILMYSGVDLKYLNVNFNNEYASLAIRAREYLDNNSIDYSNVTLVIGNSLDTYNFLTNSFKTRLNNLTVNFNEGNNFCILINKNIDKVKDIGLGLTDENFENAKELGFNNIIPRVENHEGITKEEIDDLYTQLKKYKVRTIIFAGVTVFGQNYQDKEEEILKYVGEKFSKENAEIITAIIEKPAETDLETIQRGIKSLSKYSKYVNTKVFSTDSSQLQRLSFDGLAEQWGRAISQRNVRVLYVRPLSRKEKTTQENYEDTLNAIREIKGRISYMGLKLGSAKGFGEVTQRWYLQMGMAIGVISSGFLLILLIFGEDKLKRFKKIIWLLLGLVVLFIVCGYSIPAVYSRLGDTFNKLIALAASITFASLAGVWLIDSYRNEKRLIFKSNIGKGVVLLIGSIAIAAIGGAYIASILSDSKYILKLDTFRGVKISFLLPLIIWGFAYVVKVGLYNDEEGRPLPLFSQCKMFLEAKIVVKYAVIVGVACLALVLVVMRSGNTMTSSASSLELVFRSFLEKYLVARPRTKELIAFPILFLIPYFSSFKNKEIVLFSMGIGMIGIENVINSFCHIRMPIFITSLSTIYSLIFAIIIGSIGIVIVERFSKKLRNK